MLPSLGRTSHILRTHASVKALAAASLAALLAIASAPAASATAPAAIASPAAQAAAAQPAAAAVGKDFDAKWSLPSSFSETQLAVNGQGGFPNYRIPALTVAPNGDLLASYDGRPTGGDAPGPNSILQRRSTDGGKTWQEQTVVAAGRAGADKVGYSDPSYVVDRQSGEIFNFHVKSFDQGFGGSKVGTDPENRQVLHAAVSRSKDNGLSWSTEVITAAVTNDAGWRSRFAASGQGIQLQYGAHAGRLVQQFTIINGAGQFQAHSVYSDDHGTSWKAGNPVGTGMDENKSVELSDGTIMLNSRDSAGSKGRKIAYSTDGGVNYGPVTVDTQLPDPTNNAAIVRAFPNAAQGSAAAKVLLFSNAASTSSRSNGTVRISYDDGKTFSASKVFQPGGMAYSTLATLPDGSIGLLYEPDGGNGGIRFAQFSLAWLGGLGATASAAPTTVIPGSKTTVKVTVNNVSDAKFKRGKVSLDLPAGWISEAEELSSLKPGRSDSVKLKVRVPAGAFAGDYPATIKVSAAAGTATAPLTLSVAPAKGDLVSVTPLIPKLGESYVGDRVSVSYRVKNLSSSTIAMIPTGNLGGFNRPSAPNCGYGSLAAGASYICTTGFRVVTQADLDRGSFTPETSWEVRAGGYNGALLETVVRNGPAIALEAPLGLLSKSQLSVHSVSSEETVSASSAASLAVDGDSSTVWHSAWSQSAGEQWITLDTGAARTLNALAYLPRASGNNGMLKDYRVETSSDGVSWKAVASGTLEQKQSRSTLQLTPSKARYLKLTFATSYSDAGKNFGSAAELDVFEKAASSCGQRPGKPKQGGGASVLHGHGNQNNNGHGHGNCRD